MRPDSNLDQDPWISELYDSHYAAEIMHRDVALWLSLAQQTGGPVLELACGTGRVLLPLARAGYEVTGLDLSPHQPAQRGFVQREIAPERRNQRGAATCEHAYPLSPNRTSLNSKKPFFPTTQRAAFKAPRASPSRERAT